MFTVQMIPPFNVQIPKQIEIIVICFTLKSVEWFAIIGLPIHLFYQIYYLLFIGIYTFFLSKVDSRNTAQKEISGKNTDYLDVWQASHIV